MDARDARKDPSHAWAPSPDFEPETPARCKQYFLTINQVNLFDNIFISIFIYYFFLIKFHIKYGSDRSKCEEFN